MRDRYVCRADRSPFGTDTPLPAAAPKVVKYGTGISFEAHTRGGAYHGRVKSEVRKCERGRRVVLFKKRAGADRKLGSDRTDRQGRFAVTVGRELRDSRDLVVKVRPKVRDHFVCGGLDTSHGG